MSQKVLRLLNRILNTAIVLSLIAAGLYSIYAIWDNNRIYEAPLELQTELKKLKPDEKKPSFQELLKLNPDVVGWVTLEGTQIDDPIVQGEDNREYLNKNVYGEYALAGSIFLDSRCDREFQDKYQLVYGHHMEKHRMFGDLDLYLKKKFFKSKIVMSNIGYFALFLLMGIWHGLTWYYIVYGLYHACLICLTDAWIRFKKKHKEQLPSNKFTHGLAVFLTFQAVCFGFLIFSGFLDKLFFS